MCGHCEVMPMDRESICCKELEQQNMSILEERDPATHPECITQHRVYYCVLMLNSSAGVTA